MSTQPDSPLTLEEKIDQILWYQKSQRRWAAVKSVTNLVFLVMFVVIPIVGLIYFFNWARDNLGLDLNEARQVVEGLKTIGETGDDLNGSLGGLLQGLNQNQDVTESWNELGLEDLNLQQTVQDLDTRQEDLRQFLEEVNNQ